MSVGERLRNYFDFAGHHTDFRRETLAGLTTFMTMAYIIVVNPAILKAAGIPPEASIVATALTAAFGTLLMSFTYNIGIGITAGFVLYPFAKLVAGRRSEVRSGLWVLALLSLLFFVFYPYS